MGLINIWRNNLQLTEEAGWVGSDISQAPPTSTPLSSLSLSCSISHHNRKCFSTPQGNVCNTLEKSRTCSSRVLFSSLDGSVSGSDGEQVLGLDPSHQGSQVLRTPSSSLPMTRVVSKARNREGGLLLISFPHQERVHRSSGCQLQSI